MEVRDCQRLLDSTTALLNTIGQNPQYPQKNLTCFRNNRATRISLIFLIIFLVEASVYGVTYRTRNFVVTASTADLAREFGDTAERCREELARLWLGETLPAWPQPCQVQIKMGENLGAGGETVFTFDRGNVYGLKMNIQGSYERLLDSVIPHEVTHTILASYFREPVPRWIDEGAATSVESQAERNNYRNMLIGFMKEKRGIPFNTMVKHKEYPKDLMPFYSQGFSVCEYLILVGGHRRLVEFTRIGLETGNWSHAVHEVYGYENLGDLQLRWQNWISDWYLAGMPGQLPQVEQLADITTASNQNASPMVGLIATSSPASQTVLSVPTNIFASGVGSALPDTPNASSLSNPDHSLALTQNSSNTNSAGNLTDPNSYQYRGSYGQAYTKTQDDTIAVNPSSATFVSTPQAVPVQPGFQPDHSPIILDSSCTVLGQCKR